MSKASFFYFFLFIFLFQITQVLNDSSFTNKNAYPNRKSIKGLQPDGQDINQVIGNAVHSVAMNFVWMYWQPKLKKGSCASNEFTYNSLCYTLDRSLINLVKQYTKAEVTVTAVVYGPPDWARRSCSVAVAPWFCAPTDTGAVYYGYFLRFLAYYFNGENGNGRIADFVIHNEVNAIGWFNYGCNSGNCDINTWTSVYAKNYNEAYDNVKKEQKKAKILISFQHNFFKDLDNRIRNRDAEVSCETFLTKLVPKLGGREWRIAFHSYPKDLLKPQFDANDYPYVTFGNIGAISGWLHKNYPNSPHAWEIQLTENGINGSTSSMLTNQRNYLCTAFKNILGTPGIESFIYHRLVDHPDELKDGLGCGLWSGVNQFKPAWELFALANRKDVGSGYPRCGFELLPYIEMVSGYNGAFHYVTSRTLPIGYTKQASFKVKREKGNDDVTLVFECRLGSPTGQQAFISADPNCENQFNMGPMGYLYNTKVANSVPIYRCYTSSNGDHFISSNSNCDGKGKSEALMGYGFAM